MLRYVKGTIHYGIFYNSHVPKKIVGYTDSDLGGSINDSQSTLMIFSILKGVQFLIIQKSSHLWGALNHTGRIYCSSSADCQIIWVFINVFLVKLIQLLLNFWFDIILLLNEFEKLLF